MTQKKTLTNEQIEFLLNEFFVGIKNTVWNSSGVTFDYDGESNNVHIDLSATLDEMEDRIIRADAKLEQSEKLYSILLDKCLGFEILGGEDLEDDGESWKNG